MHTPNDHSSSRRKWLGIAAGASLGSGLLAATGAIAEPAAKHSEPSPADLGARMYNVRDFGAKGDGTTLDTAALQSAIDACTKDQGGTVLVPAGVFVIGTVELKSNVTLHLSASAKLLGSADGKQYHAADAIPLHGDSTLGDGNVGLLFAVKADNITIEGAGTIDGQGAQFHSPTRGVMPPAGISGDNRPYHLLFHQCNNLTVRNIFLNDSAYHSVRVIQSKFVKMQGLRIYNRVNGNNDGFHFISCQHVHVSDCTVECRTTPAPCSAPANSSPSPTPRLARAGRSSASAAAKPKTSPSPTASSTKLTAVPIKMRCGPDSRFENISFSNLVMTNVTGPISIGLGDPPRRPQPAAQPGAPPSGMSASETGMAPGQPGVVRNITFSNIRATVVTPVPLPDLPLTTDYRPGELKACITVNGAGEAFIENIVFDNVQVTFPGGGTAEEAAHRDVPHVAGEYFELGTLPSYALYARRVRGLTMSNVRFDVTSPELRPAVVFDHVEDAAVIGLSAQGNPQSESLLRFIDSRDILLTAARVLTPSAVFLRVEGAKSDRIRIDGGDLSKAADPVSFHAGADEQSVSLRD